MSEASPPVGRATPPTDTAPWTPRSIDVAVWHVDRSGFDVDHPYVRTWWTCVLGPSAVTDLLRMVRAAEGGRVTMPRPHGIEQLVAAGLALVVAGTVVVPLPVPPVGPPHSDRIPHHLRARHARDLAA